MQFLGKKKFKKNDKKFGLRGEKKQEKNVEGLQIEKKNKTEIEELFGNETKKAGNKHNKALILPKSKKHKKCKKKRACPPQNFFKGPLGVQPTAKKRHWLAHPKYTKKQTVISFRIGLISPNWRKCKQMHKKCPLCEFFEWPFLP